MRLSYLPMQGSMRLLMVLDTAAITVAVVGAGELTEMETIFTGQGLRVDNLL